MLKSWGLMVANEILVTVQSPNSPFPFLELTEGFGARTLDWDLALGLLFINLSMSGT